jgi:hypothetical protein
MVIMNLDLGGKTALVSGMTTIETSQGWQELQIGFVGFGKPGGLRAVRVNTAVHDLRGWDVVEETLL